VQQGAADERPPAARARAREPGQRPASEVARAALEFTAFVSGPGVYGAGVVLDTSGHIVTCWHVVEGIDEITVALASGARHPALVVDADSRLDLALLKIDTETAPAMTPASIAALEAGDELFAMGAPRKMKFSLSRGMASFVGRPFDGVYYLQSDLALNGGNSGGPVMNRMGEVVAISSFVLKQSEGLSFALPIDYALRRFARWLKASPALEGTANEAFEDWLSVMDAANPSADE
jgi:S1-C subfamily serine protease